MMKAQAQQQQQEDGTGSARAAGVEAPSQPHQSQQQQTEQQEQQQQQGQTQQQSAARPGLGQRVRKAATVIAKEVRAVLSPEEPSTSALRGAAKAGDIKTAETSEVMISSASETGYQKQWRDMSEKVRRALQGCMACIKWGGNPLGVLRGAQKWGEVRFPNMMMRRLRGKGWTGRWH